MYTISVTTARDRLIESAQELLWERGYVGTSPRAIQERAGAGQGSMYHHFAGKPELAAEAVRRSAAALRAAAEAELSGPGPALERIAAYLRPPREVLRGCRMGRLAQDPEVVARPELREPVAAALGWTRDRLAEALAGGQARGEVDARVDPRATAAALVAVLQGGYVVARAAGTEAPFHEAVEGALALLQAAAAPGRPAAT
jgi:AcrR family transcriptional regulator